MIARKNAQSSSNANSTSDSRANRKWIVLALTLFAVGGFIGFTYGQAGPIVSHAVDQIVWSAITLTTSPGAPEMITALKKGAPTSPGNIWNGATSPNDITKGINADFVDGFDSQTFLGASTGGSSYTNSCAWMASTTYNTNYPQPDPLVDFYETQCELPDGVTKTSYPGVPSGEPPACAGTYTSQGIRCYPTGVDIFSPQPFEVGAGGVYQYPSGPNPPGVGAPVVLVTVGMCERICTQ